MSRFRPPYPKRDQVATIIHAWCRDCDWTSNGKTTRSRAAEHTRYRRHVVQTTSTTVAHYVPRLEAVRDQPWFRQGAAGHTTTEDLENDRHGAERT